MFKSKRFSLLSLAMSVLAGSMLFLTPAISSATECGLSCCIAGAAEGMGAGGKGLNIDLQYEWMKMDTILDGSSEVSPNEVLESKMGTMFMVPTEMIMKKLTANIAYGINKKTSILVSIPYVENDMDMRRSNMMGMKPYTDRSMDTVDDLGDVTLMAFRTVHIDRNIAPTERLTIGVGVKTPTGEYEEKNSMGTDYVHMMMQPGTGSWDPIVLVNAMKKFGNTYLLGTVTYQFTTENDHDYEVGNKLSIDITAKRQLTDLFNGTLALNYVHADQDKAKIQADGFDYQNPMMSLIDNTDNTGLTSYFITPGIEFKPAAGSPWTFKARARIPVSQDVKGIQQVTDNWYVLNAGYRF